MIINLINGTMELIKENSFAKAEYDPETGIVYTRYAGTVDPQKAIEVLEAQLEFSKSNEVKAIRADLSELKGTYTMLNEWLESKFFPVLIERGMKCHAFIVPSDIFSSFATKDLIKRVGDFEMGTFNDNQKSVDWILEKIK